ncbi:outer membrane protein [Anianabacter salinae]|uniref:outer membrane protein n=1 Tax=Anianabacter salinae TaxID=2851023 RepID=UPI00225E323D|nr:outer membrane beta-barrel protein [Anianabacter salinae]MBV0911885.1 outer membrane beta-barrel protein [Anianabacter salinae]
MINLKSAAVATSALLLGTAASADNNYWTLHGSYGPFLEAHSFFAPNSNAGGPLSGTVNYDDAFTIGGSIGRFVTPNVRIGVEINYFSLDTTSMDVVYPTPPPNDNVLLGGSIRGASAFVDAAYEHRFNDRFSGFVEAGAGVLTLSASNIQTGPNFNGFIDDSATVFAGKIGVGTIYRLSERIELLAKYTYVKGEDANMRFTAPGAGIPSVPFSIETSAHNVQVGVRMRF